MRVFKRLSIVKFGSVLFFLPFCFIGNAVGQTQRASATGQIHLNDGAMKEMISFFGEASAEEVKLFSKSLIQEFQNRFDGHVYFKRESGEGTCSERVNLSIGELNHSKQYPKFRDFEKDFLRIDSIACIPFQNALSVESIRSTLLDDKFQMKAYEGLSDSKTDLVKGRVCQASSVRAMGNFAYCSSVRIHEGNGFSLILNLNDYNSPKATAKVYFRLSASLVRKMKNGFEVYNLTFARVPEIPIKFLARKLLKSEQGDAIRKLKDILSGTDSQSPKVEGLNSMFRL